MDKLPIIGDDMNHQDLWEIFNDIIEKINNQIDLLMEVPDYSWLKADIQDWLKVRHISYDASDTKSQLLEKI